MLLLAQAAAVGSWPFVVLVVSIGFLILLITKLRVHAFLALVLAAIAAGLMSQRLPEARPRGEAPPPPRVSTAGTPVDKRPSHWVQAVSLTAREFGVTAGKIGIVIGLASIIGMCLMESGAADKVVRRFLAVFGEKRAGIALLVSTYILSIPIFFDTMFMLMVPLAKALRQRTGRDYVLYVLAICCGGVITHSLTVPHPGPTAMVDTLKLDVGFSILAGIAVGIIPCWVGWYVCRWINSRLTVPLRESPGASLADLQKIMGKPESELPSFAAAILPVVLPIVLISLASFSEVIGRDIPALVNLLGGPVVFARITEVVQFIGERHVALAVGAVLALIVLARQKKLGLGQIEELIGPPLQTAGIIILITAAGGAFGGMLQNAGVGQAIKEAAQGRSVNLVILSFVVAFVIRIAQGSATVAMQTTAGIMAAMLDPNVADHLVLSHNMVYIFLAIGFGAFACSWMNDSGFWVVSKLGGLTEGETLKSWTLMLTVVAFVGLAVTLALSKFLPLAGG